MNLDNDYDNDGNNIVPCPICMSNYCPSKEDGKCPEEDMFALEGEIRMLLEEYKATDDKSRIANVLEFVEKLLQAERQKREGVVHKDGYMLGVKNTLEWAELNCLAYKDVNRVLKQIEDEKQALTQPNNQK